MIIPIKCFTCGKVIADKYRFYLKEVRRLKLEQENQEPQDEFSQESILYLTNENTEKTPEGIVLDNLGFTRICCRRHMITHVDIH